MGKTKRYLRKGISVLKHEGPRALAAKSLRKLAKEQQKKTLSPTAKIQYTSLVARSDAVKANWVTRPYHPQPAKAKKPYVFNWVMSPPGGGGGHQNIFRFIEYLDAQGHSNNIYIYSTFDDMTIAQARENVKAYCQAKHLSFSRYKGSMAPSDVVFATGWETAYPVFNDVTAARKMYFIQDFEPYFYPMGTDYVLAENTYKFGFYGITAGGWLAKKLHDDYSMKCDYYDFGADKNLYELTNTSVRKEIFFYARPVTERRGFDLGIMALEIFHKQMPEYTINLAGWDVAGYDIPFPYVNHKAMQLNELSGLYNRNAAALVISLTNMSLLPLELLACGTIPVVNDGLNNRLVSNNPNIVYTPASPDAFAAALVQTVKRKDLAQHAVTAAKSVPSHGWLQACQKFEQSIDKELKNV